MPKNFEVWIGRLATLVAAITTPWALAVSAVLAFVVGAFRWATDLVLSPPIEGGAATFLVVLWTLIGLRQLRSYRDPLLIKEPLLIKPHQDFAYGLTFEGCIPNYSPESVAGALQFMLQIRNYSPGPLRITLQKFDVILGTRTLPHIKQSFGSTFIPRGGARGVRCAPFKMDDIREFIGKHIEGTVDFVFAYGPPEGPHVRTLKMILTVALDIKEAPPSLGWADFITEESDGPISTL